jgi:hypothetical protein
LKKISNKESGSFLPIAIRKMGKLKLKGIIGESEGVYISGYKWLRKVLLIKSPLKKS